MLTLFEMSTLEMWPNVMFLINDTVEQGVAPSRDANTSMAAYSIF